MHLAYTSAPGRGDVDLILLDLARRLAARGLRCCGVAQIDTPTGTGHACDMDVLVLPDGPRLRISQDLGAAARGCRLDPGALETSVALSARRLAEGADVLIVNKFGKHEAEGRGFRDLIAEAVGRGLPVLVGLNGRNLPAFQAFAADLAVELPPRVEALLDWTLHARAGAFAAA